MSIAPNADRFTPLSETDSERWAGNFPPTAVPNFPRFVDLKLEEVRKGYARMRVPFRPEMNQPMGVMHGGVIATLIDTVVVPAIASMYEEFPGLLTINLDIQYMGAVIEQDAIAEGWIEKQGRSITFCRAEVRNAAGEIAAQASIVYRVRPKKKEGEA